jgi:hypothetical protein
VGVGAHRAQRFGAGARHRRHQQVELLVGESEDLLPQHDPVMRHADVIARGEFVDVEQAGVQPLLVRVLGRQLGLDLLVVDDAALGRVDQEHPARLQPHLLDHSRRVEVQHARLGRHYDETVAGDPNA